MNDIAKYSLELKSKDEDYTRYHIVGLQKAYYKYDWDKGKLEDFGGAAGLIESHIMFRESKWIMMAILLL